MKSLQREGEFRWKLELKPTSQGKCGASPCPGAGGRLCINPSRAHELCHEARIHCRISAASPVNFALNRDKGGGPV